MANHAMEPEILERPKTPVPETPMYHQPAMAPTLPFPFYPAFPPAPGLIPHPIGAMAHPMFPRFPMPMGRGMQHPAMPNLSLPPRFMNPAANQIKTDDLTITKVKQMPEPEKPMTPTISTLTVTPVTTKMKKEKAEKAKLKEDSMKYFPHGVNSSLSITPVMTTPQPPALPTGIVIKSVKPEKAEKV